MAFTIGERVGDYEVLGLIGTGGMGCVYRVRNVISERTEAMKVLLADLQAEPELATRFLREIRTLATLDHPNIAQLHTALQIGNQLLMVMEFVEGMTLAQLRQQSPLSPEQVISYVHQLLAALSFAHARGVVHRDLKPANVMVTSQGMVKLTDFGIAKSKAIKELTQPGTTMGSLNYMSPEQAAGKGVDGRSDLYSVGITMYELLAGNLPFADESAYVVLHNQLNVPPRPPIELNPLLPRALNDVILKALEKDPAERFQSAVDFSDALLKASGIAPLAPLDRSPMAGRAAPAVPGKGPVTVPQKAAPTSRFLTASRAKFWLVAEGSAAIILLASATAGFVHLGRNGVMAQGMDVAVEQAPAPAPANLLVTTTVGNSKPAPPEPAAVKPSSRHKQDHVPAEATEKPRADSTELEELRERKAQLDARAATLRLTVQRMKSEREAEGDGLDQEVAGAYVRMNAYLSAEKSDLQDGDTTAARDHMDKAAHEISVLEGMFTRASKGN